jgi:hypothetical protein
LPFFVTEHLDTSHLGGIDQRPAAIGATAIQQLDAQLQSGEKGLPEVPNATVITGCWVPAKAAANLTINKAPVAFHDL